MADRVLQVEVVAHEGRLWHGTGTSVQIPVVDGQLGILPGRQPLLAMLKAGTVSVTTKDGVETFTIEGGFASVDSDFVTVVADHGTVS
ncbi:F0F1 ATP synthase subunit epsilon [Actinomyces culturomici]|uniref:F0F1 ATP synthase subunit epsilon n=1 Tax=Actinomyces culturomici TaxID=1926276 RepID=UPI000E203800|nr:F0F1 ATP synthase subunit epsilon [Actinomyces culturomici]